MILLTLLMSIIMVVSLAGIIINSNKIGEQL